MTETTDKLAHAREQAKAQFESIKDMVERLAGWQKAAEAEGWTCEKGVFRHQGGVPWQYASWQELCAAQGVEAERDEDVEQEIHEDALSVEVRSDWYTPGSADTKPAEYKILLCTGGPAVKITGELNEHGEPTTASLQMQDWFTPWTDWTDAAFDHSDVEETLLAYARCFYFGE